MTETRRRPGRAPTGQAQTATDTCAATAPATVPIAVGRRIIASMGKAKHQRKGCISVASSAYNGAIETNTTMNAPDKLLKIPVVPGVYVLRSAPANARSSRRRAASLLLTTMRRGQRTRAGKTGRAYLKDVRAARDGR